MGKVLPPTGKSDFHCLVVILLSRLYDFNFVCLFSKKNLRSAGQHMVLNLYLTAGQPILCNRNTICKQFISSLSIFLKRKKVLKKHTSQFKIQNHACLMLMPQGDIYRQSMVQELYMWNMMLKINKVKQVIQI